MAGSLITKSDSHVDVPLSMFSHKLGPGDGFIADQLFPVQSVAKESDKYFKVGNEDIQTNYETLRADTDRAKEIKISASTDSYQTEEHALAALLTDRQRANADSQLRIEQQLVTVLTHNILMGFEKRIETIVTDTAQITQTAVPSIKWDVGDSTSTIEADIDLAKETVAKNCGYNANVIVIPPIVAQPVKRSPEIRDIRKYVESGLTMNGDLPSTLFGLRVLIPGSIEDARKLNATSSSLARIWAQDKVLVAYINPNPGAFSNGLGISFRLNIGPGGVGSRVRRWRDPDRVGDKYEVALNQDEKLVDATCGYIIDDVL